MMVIPVKQHILYNPVPSYVPTQIRHIRPPPHPELSMKTEEAAASVEAMRLQAERLAEVVGVFKVASNAPRLLRAA